MKVPRELGYGQTSGLYKAYMYTLYSLQNIITIIIYCIFNGISDNNSFQLRTENFIFDSSECLIKLWWLQISNSQAFWVSAHNNIHWDSASNCFILKKFPNKICGGEESFKQKQNRTLSSINVPTKFGNQVCFSISALDRKIFNMLGLFIIFIILILEFLNPLKVKN